MAERVPYGDRFVPSQPRYWVGRPAHDRSGQTVEQQEYCARFGVRMRQTQECYDLPAVYSVRVMFEPKQTHMIAESRYFVCPVVNCSKDRTRLCVVAPNGMETWTNWVQP